MRRGNCCLYLVACLIVALGLEAPSLRSQSNAKKVKPPTAAASGGVEQTSPRSREFPKARGIPAARPPPSLCGNPRLRRRLQRVPTLRPALRVSNMSLRIGNGRETRMLLEIVSCARRDPSGRCLRWIAILAVAALLPVAPRALGQSCPFTTCGDGSDGALNYTGQSGMVVFDPVALGLHGTGDAFCVYNFTSITIPAGLTVQLSANKVNCPVYWLSQGDVNIAGTLSLRGTDGSAATLNTALRFPAPPGSGGFPGGVGGNITTNQAATAGSGPGGGAPGSYYSPYPSGGTFTGNHFLVPLVGGSGGGGVNQNGQFGGGGGGGGGAILIGSSTQIIVPGIISADGGNGQYGSQGGCGSGGAIRLVSNTITASGTLSAIGYYTTGGTSAGTPGQIRLEATTINFTGTLCDSSYACSTPLAESNPLPLLVPTTRQPSVQVTQINGMKITENPATFPDATINTSSPVPVVITAHQVPMGTVPILYIFSETQDLDAQPCSGGLQGTLATSTCTVNIIYPPTDSRGFVRATWSAPPP